MLTDVWGAVLDLLFDEDVAVDDVDSRDLFTPVVGRDGRGIARIG